MERAYEPLLDDKVLSLTFAMSAAHDGPTSDDSVVLRAVLRILSRRKSSDGAEQGHPHHNDYRSTGCDDER